MGSGDPRHFEGQAVDDLVGHVVVGPFEVEIEEVAAVRHCRASNRNREVIVAGIEREHSFGLIAAKTGHPDGRSKIVADTQVDDDPIFRSACNVDGGVKHPVAKFGRSTSEKKWLFRQCRGDIGASLHALLFVFVGHVDHRTGCSDSAAFEQNAL